MRDRRRTTAAVLAGGVVLASAGFAIGSQAGDGSATAREGRAGADRDRGVHLHFTSLAERLGVSEARLRDALEDLRPAGDPGDELAAALASSLGVDRAKVEAALEELRSQHERRHDEHAEELADALGVDADRVREAFENLKPDGRRGGPRMRGPAAFLGDLAWELGVSRAKLRAALREVGPPGPGPVGPRGRHHGPGGPGPGGAMLADELAEELGVDASRVEEALEDFHEAKRDEFSQKLAGALGIDVDKVKDALPPHP